MRRRLLVVGAAAAALLSACGSPDHAPAPSTSQPVTGHGAYAACLAEHGVQTPPAGPVAPPGVDEQTWTQAQQACADKAPGPAH